MCADVASEVVQDLHQDVRPLSPCAQVPDAWCNKGEGQPSGVTGHTMNTTTLTPHQSTRPLTDDLTIETMPIRGLLVGLLIAMPFWLLLAGLTAWIL